MSRVWVAAVAAGLVVAAAGCTAGPGGEPGAVICRITAGAATYYLNISEASNLPECVVGQRFRGTVNDLISLGMDERCVLRPRRDVSGMVVVAYSDLAYADQVAAQRYCRAGGADA